MIKHIVLAKDYEEFFKWFQTTNYPRKEVLFLGDPHALNESIISTAADYPEKPIGYALKRFNNTNTAYEVKEQLLPFVSKIVIEH